METVRMVHDCSRKVAHDGRMPREFMSSPMVSKRDEGVHLYNSPSFRESSPPALSASHPTRSSIGIPIALRFLPLLDRMGLQPYGVVTLKGMLLPERQVSCAARVLPRVPKLLAPSTNSPARLIVSISATI